MAIIDPNGDASMLEGMVVGVHYDDGALGSGVDRSQVVGRFVIRRAGIVDGDIGHDQGEVEILATDLEIDTLTYAHRHNRWVRIDRTTGHITVDPDFSRVGK